MGARFSLAPGGATVAAAGLAGCTIPRLGRRSLYDHPAALAAMYCLASYKLCVEFPAKLTLGYCRCPI